MIFFVYKYNHIDKHLRDRTMLGMIIVRWAKNHVKWSKNDQFCQMPVCNTTLMSCSSSKFVLNDIYECWKIQKFFFFNKLIFGFTKRLLNFHTKKSILIG